MNWKKLFPVIVVLAVLLAALNYAVGLREQDQNPTTLNGQDEEFDQEGSLVFDDPALAPGSIYLSYRASDSQDLLVALVIDADSRCLIDGAPEDCRQVGFSQGQYVRVEGVRRGDTVLIEILETLPMEQAMRPVNLYYYNQAKDIAIGQGEAACSAEAVEPVSREIALTDTPIQDTIEELLRGNLTAAEKQRGFSTEFPREGFVLQGANLQNGVLTLAFSEVPGFTTGGACRTALLRAQIEKTALQFPEVSEIRFSPDDLFQP